MTITKKMYCKEDDPFNGSEFCKKIDGFYMFDDLMNDSKSR